jgi:hypothetical protein
MGKEQTNKARCSTMLIAWRIFGLMTNKNKQSLFYLVVCGALALVYSCAGA